jgi:hypothetical protein
MDIRYSKSTKVKAVSYVVIIQIGSASDRLVLIFNTCIPMGGKFCATVEKLVKALTGKDVEVALDWDEHYAMQQVRSGRMKNAGSLLAKGMPMNEIIEQEEGPPKGIRTNRRSRLAPGPPRKEPNEREHYHGHNPDLLPDPVCAGAVAVGFCVVLPYMG